MDQQDRSAGLKCETNGALGWGERENVQTPAVLMSKSQARFTYQGSYSYQINKNSLLLHSWLRSRSNQLSTVRFTSKALSGFGGFSAPVMDLFPAVLTLFTLLGVENTDLRDQFTSAGWEPDRTPVTPQQCIFYSRSAFAKTRLNSKSFSYHSGVLKCFWKFWPVWNCLCWQHFTKLKRDVCRETRCPWAQPITRIRLTNMMLDMRAIQASAVILVIIWTGSDRDRHSEWMFFAALKWLHPQDKFLRWKHNVSP